ncbi:MAG: hypothetical protein EOO53_19595 [Gammaproteobacteria bacterium]|nr:MAG: hypothetical protein EOO53_19595 [Gammaproteobacteria bacterium]
MSQVKSFSIHAFTIIFNAAISFATFSVLTHHLNEVDYGIINLYTSFIVFLTPFIGIGAQFTIGIDYFKMEASAFRHHFTNVIAIPFLSFIVFTLLTFLLSGYIKGFVHVNYFFTIVIPFVSLLSVVNDIVLTLIRDQGKHRLFAIYAISKNLLEISFTLLFVVVLNYNWQGRLASGFLSYVSVLIFTVYLLRKWKFFTGKFKKAELLKNFTIGLPFVPERLAIFILGYSDRIFINHYQGIGDVGFYSAGAQVAMIVSLGISALNNTFYPSIYRKLSEPVPNVAEIKKIVFVFISVITVVTISVVLATPILFKYFIGPRFQAGKEYACYLTIGLFFWGIYNVFLPFLLYIKKNRLVMFISVFGTCLSLGINFFNIKHFGAIGATYTSMIVYFVMAATTIFFVCKYYNLNNAFKNYMRTI